MEPLKNKIDFKLIISVRNANPNGDPADNGRPRMNWDGYGEISPVCLKRKIRNRLCDMGENILIKKDEQNDDGYKSIDARVASVPELDKLKKKPKDFTRRASEIWTDVRYFGHVFLLNPPIGVTGPVSLQTAVSVEPIDVLRVESAGKFPRGVRKKKTMNWYSQYITSGIYVVNGGINCKRAEETGFCYNDAQMLKKCLVSLFQNDESNARPAGSMAVEKLYWWEHNCEDGQYTPAKVFRSVNVLPAGEYPYYTTQHTPLDELVPEIHEE